MRGRERSLPRALESELERSEEMAEIQEVPIKDIVIQERARSDFGDIASLAESIRKFGFDNPLTVKETEEGKYLLIAGERRFRAAIYLGMLKVPVVVRNDLNEEEVKLLELEENIQRRDLSWSERIEWEKQYYELMKKRGKTLDDVAEKLNSSAPTLSREISLARKIEENPELMEEIGRLPLHAAIRRAERLEEIKKLEKEGVEVSGLIKQGDARELFKDVKDGEIGLVVTDPPFGIDTLEDNRGSQINVQVELLKDTDNMRSDMMKELMRDVFREMKRTLKEGSHFYVFTSSEWWKFLSDLARDAGLETQNYPIIWLKPTTTAPARGYQYAPIFETILFGWKPPRKRLLEKSASACLKYKPVPSKERVHPFQKPLDLLEFLIKQSSLPGEIVLDPFAGSGTTLVAALRMRRKALGFELNEEHVKNAERMISEELRRIEE